MLHFVTQAISYKIHRVISVYTHYFQCERIIAMIMETPFFVYRMCCPFEKKGAGFELFMRDFV